MSEQQITKEQLINTIEKSKSFEYNYKGGSYTGYYEPKTKVFVPVSKTNNRIPTVMKSRQGYINKLKGGGKKWK